MPDIQRLRVFRAVVASGSVNQAATNLSYTPSAVSQHLAALQRETGLRLVERNGRGIRITATGRLLADEAAGVLDRLATFDGVVADLRAGRVGSLSVSYFPSAGAAWIPPVVATLSREFPDLRVELWGNELATDRRAGPDIAVFVADPQGDRAPGYQVLPLLEEPYLAVLPESHRLAGQRSVPLRDLAEESWVDNDFTHGPCRQVVLDACSSVGFSPDFRVETHDYPTAISFVAAGVGVTVLPRLGVGAMLPTGLVALPVVDPVPRRRIAIKVRESVSDNPATQRVVALLRERAAQPTGVTPA
ncbi:LysR family transcriptional regulator [Natronosporangium hydrolyticum]|uniref:LysR family transcriptional regulator n=1 Tax=Natronosporangium hydrolyticum TaxID=2811111 RepID=A0A895YGE9_9ACTN|nr:LysR family transcriptional regulator [Natronosporangium hydrolyticum]QSB16641.1 LysR family transcriptional regulator [Natronosporangium hydrolyticum]